MKKVENQYLYLFSLRIGGEYDFKSDKKPPKEKNYEDVMNHKSSYGLQQ